MFNLHSLTESIDIIVLCYVAIFLMSKTKTSSKETIFGLSLVGRLFGSFKYIYQRLF